MTNRDVIDKMTNEELGRFLDHIDCINCAYHENEGECVPDICNGLKHCAEGIAKWLDQEPDFRMADYIKDGAKRMIVTICGSMRHLSVMLREYERLSLEGCLVYLPVILGVCMDGDTIRITHLPKLSDNLKEHLQQLHFKKILLSDFIFVVNPGGYIGEGTAEEIEYAKLCGIPVKYLEEVK